ncbi:protein phosphatase 1 regulatory subunit 12A-like [Diaphorina citri]|uniref:Protein phosphatase 1 regulatory subunit 12B n=1 Tax=Diaphorina citri TaxID=121845 RepID=A0A3Q0J7Q1_DIACI|nr:protein phosphatase 1 regulatory subunit 12A-like [Diaphorina citri]
MSETRSSSALFKRAEQLKRWEESETNRQPSEMGNKPKKIKFSSGCVFLAACASSDKEEVLNLLKSGADINTANVDGLTALHQACIDNNLDMVEFLVENHADVNRGDNEGWTPLHATASCGFLSIAKYLIEHSANVAACNNDGELAIDIAESDEMEDLLQRHIELQGINPEDARTFEERSMLEDAKFWLSSGCLGDVPNPKTGASALHVAAAKGYIKVMNILIQAGADLNFQDYDGWTPLHAAAHWAQREACQILVENFCDMDVKNYVGQTCFDIADVELVSFLEDLRKKQASMERSQQDINNIASKQQQQRNNILPKRRLSSDRSPLSKAGGEAPHTPSGGGDGSVTIGGEEDATPADKMAKVEVRDRKMDTSSGAPGGGDRNEQDLKNRLNREDTSPKISPSATNASAVTNSTNSSSSVPSNNNNNNAVTSPSPKTEDEIFWKPASGLRRKTTDTKNITLSKLLSASLSGSVF